MLKTISIMGMVAFGMAALPSPTYAQMANDSGSMSGQGGMTNGGMGSNSMEKNSMGGASMSKSKMHKKHHTMMKHRRMNSGM